MRADEEASVLADAVRIKMELRTYDRVRIECADEEEAIAISALLTPTERDRVQFTWRVWQ